MNADKRKVLIITNMPSPYQLEFFNALASVFVNLKVVFLRKSVQKRKWSMPEDMRFQHEILSGSLAKRIKYTLAILNEQFDIYIISGYNLPEEFIAINFLANSNKKWIFWAEKPKLAHIGSKKRVLWALKHVNLIAGIGSCAARIYNEVFNVPVFNLPYYCNLNRYKKAHREKTTRVKFMFSGSLIRRKGVDVIIEAYADLYRYYKNIEMHFLGDGNIRNFINRYITQHKLENVFMYGFHNWNELPGFYKKGDVFVFPSRYDGWGVAVNEAMAAGMPVITTYTTGAAFDLISHGENGYVIEPDNVEALKLYMERFITSPQLIDIMGQKAQSYVFANWSLEKGVERFARMLDLLA